MTEEHIHNIVNLYLTFHKAIPNAARSHFQDISRLFAPVLGTEKVDRAVMSFFSDENRKILRAESSRSLSSSVRLIGSSRLLTRVLAKNERLLCVGMLLRLLKENQRHTDKELLDNVGVVADIFSISKAGLDAMKNLFFDEHPHADYYPGSILLTSARPDYNMVVDGLRFISTEKLKIKAWFLHFPECNVTLVKILENDMPDDVFTFRKNDIFPFHATFKNYLELNKVNTKTVLRELTIPVPYVPHVLITQTDLTPRVLLDPVRNRIELTGNCLAIAEQHFFAPVFRWIDRFCSQAPPVFEIHVNLNYFNTYSSKLLLEIFLKVKRLEQFGTEIRFFWYYMHDDEELRESGEHYEDIVKVKFNFVEVESPELNLAAQ